MSTPIQSKPIRRTILARSLNREDREKIPQHGTNHRDEFSAGSATGVGMSDWFDDLIGKPAVPPILVGMPPFIHL